MSLPLRQGTRGAGAAHRPWDAARARAGLYPAALPYLAERHIAVPDSDGNNDTAASAVDDVDFPVHVLAINALGMHLLDLPAAGRTRQPVRGSRLLVFLCAIAPLRLPRGTGSPVNPSRLPDRDAVSRCAGDGVRRSAVVRGRRAGARWLGDL